MVLDPRQRPTVRASVDYAFSGRKTTARQLLSESITSFQHAHRLDLRIGLGLLFFKRTHDRVHINLQYPGCVADTASVQGHVDDLFFDAGLVGLLSVVELKTSLAGFTFVAGPPVRLMAFGGDAFTSNGLLVVTVAARNGDSYHAVETQSPRLRHDRPS